MKFLLLMTFIFPFSHSVYPRPPFLRGKGLNLLPNFQKGGGGGLTGPQLLERHDSFRGGGAVLHKRLTKILNN